jgi:hypothetical protein
LKVITLVLHDLSQQAASEAEARALKDRCEHILEKAIPIEIYRAIRSGCSKRPSHVTNIGTIIRIEFVGLRECVSTMSPSQVMEALSTIFDTFEEVISKYPAVHCVQWTEEAIVSCCGLFDYSTEIRTQAEQAANACLEFRSLKEEINDKCVLDLQFRFSVVQGGPLMGSSLDQTTPNFDLMGDIVKLSEIICREAAPGTIRLNSDVQESLDPFRFVTQRTAKGPKDLMDTIILAEAVE